MVATEGLHKEIIHTLANTFINRSQAFFMLCFQNQLMYQLRLQPHIVHWSIKPPQKHHSLFFAKTPLKSANCPSLACFLQIQ